MRSLRVFLIGAAMCMLQVGLAHAAITWETVPDVNYYEFRYSAQNAGNIFDGNMGFEPLPQNLAVSSSAQGSSFSSTASQSYSKLGGAVQMSAMGKGPDGGVQPLDGIQVQGYTSFSNSNANYMVEVTQGVTSWISRRFTVGGVESYNLSASLAGLVDFNKIGNAGDAFHAVWSMGGTVTIDEFVMSGAGLQGLGTIATLELSDLNRTADQMVQFRKQTPQGDPIIYQFKAVLNLSTDLQNMFMFSKTGTLTGEWKLGNAGSPISLVAALGDSAPVPIPGSVVLLLSGLGGLAWARRKFNS